MQSLELFHIAKLKLYPLKNKSSVSLSPAFGNHHFIFLLSVSACLSVCLICENVTVFILGKWNLKIRTVRQTPWPHLEVHEHLESPVPVHLPPAVQFEAAAPFMWA